MFDQLTARLTEAIQRVTGRGRITEDNVRETVRTIRMALLEADVALPVAKALVERVRDRALGEEVARSLNPGQAFVKIVHDELIAVLGGDASPVNPHGHPAVVMLDGRVAQLGTPSERSNSSHVSILLNSLNRSTRKTTSAGRGATA